MRFRELPKIRVRRNRDGSKTWWSDWTETTAGKRAHRSVVLGDCRTVTKAEAKERLSQHLGERASTAPTWTVERFVREVWLPPRLKKCHNTVVNLTAQLEAHILPAFGPMLLAGVHKFDVVRFLGDLAEKGYRKRTGECLLAIIRAVFLEAEENGLLEKNPAARVKLPEMVPAEETRPFTEAEVAFLTAQPGADGLILRVLLFTGLRPGEVLALVPGDVAGRLLTVATSTDYPGHVKSTKTGKSRAVPLPPIVADELAALAVATEPGVPIFGRWHSVNYLQSSLRKRLAGIVPGFALRRCRTTFATLFGGEIADVQDILGHTTEAMTRRHYVKAIPERAARAVEELERRAMRAEAVQ